MHLAHHALVFVSIIFTLYRELILSDEINTFSSYVLVLIAPELPWTPHRQLPTLAALSTAVFRMV